MMGVLLLADFIYLLPTGRNCSHLSCIHLPMIPLVIALPLDVWDILFAEQPSSEEWHIAIRLIFE
jgi:hypothetical protein